MLENIKRIPSGLGGDCVLLIGRDKTAVIDAGMAYGGQKLIEMLKRELKGRPLDYVLLSHSHYDHAGGVPYLKQEWPGVQICGALHAQQVFQRPGALSGIRRLSEEAAKEYLGEEALPLTYKDEDLKVDTVLSDGDVLSLGDRSVLVLDTPGHTHCSLSYFLQEEGILFHCESIGVYAGNGAMVSPILTAFSETLHSIEICRGCHPAHIVSPHYGEVRGIGCQEYFDLAEAAAYEMKDFILEQHQRGLSAEQILVACTKRFWTEKKSVRKEQPLAAFTLNTQAAIKVILKEFAPKLQCTHEAVTGIDEDLVKALGLTLQGVHENGEAMAALALAIKEKEEQPFCVLPFCHTIEGEALRGYVCRTAGDVLNLPVIDYTAGRMKALLEACRCLSERGETVCLNMSGPFTILNVLMDIMDVFRMIDKEGELSQKVFDKLREELLQYVLEAKKAGVQIISYADPTEAPEIVGPELAKRIAEQFTIPFLKAAEKLADREMLILLCPKISGVLLSTEKARWEDVKLPESMPYGQACKWAVGKVAFVGQVCAKNFQFELADGVVKSIKLV